MQINKNYSASIYDNIIPINEVVNTPLKWETADSINAQALTSYLSHSRISDLNWYEDNLVPALEYLDAKISASRKTLTFWDAYHITTTAHDVNSFIQASGSLANNSGLIIDATQIDMGDTIYHRGDVVFRDFYGSLVHVPSAQTGYYKPTNITSRGNSVYDIQFEYQSGAGADFTTQMEVPNMQPIQNYAYNINMTVQPHENPVIDLIKTSDNQVIMPVWEALYEGERILNVITTQYNLDPNYLECYFNNNSDLTIQLLIK